ncbi:MAG: serine protease [Betaproteobacteria bacterium HGW-Betaproteobacteria-2]|nr:MAG: serine protease [Betaproteobacteria bacterium HGW-Betaproteobacteria-2]
MRYFLVLLATCSLVPSAYAYDRTKLLESFFSSVMVRGYKFDGGLAYGSGVVVGENKVLTNCHTFRDTEKVWVSRGEDSYKIVSVQANRWHDLCLLKTEDMNVDPVPIGSADTLKKGDEVVSIGHSSGVPTPLTSNGTVKSLFEMDKGNVIRTTAKFALGASGSGLFDNEGRLVGINTFKTGGRDAYFYVLPIEWLAELETREVETRFPIKGDAFWEGIVPDTMPYFLQIAKPQLTEDWVELGKVATRWIKAEPDNSDAWFELGLANEKLGKNVEAEKAYRKSVELDAGNTDSLFRIGVMASAKGDIQEAYAISMTLSNINKNIATEYRKALNARQAVDF